MPKILVSTDEHDQWKLQCLKPDGSVCGEWVIVANGDRPAQPVVHCSGCKEGFYVGLTQTEAELMQESIRRKRRERSDNKDKEE